MTSSLLDVRRGSQQPRVANFPPYPLSAAPEVIDLARSAGLVLDPWQRDILTHGLGIHADGRYTASRVSTWVPRQNGKGAIIEALELAWLFLFDEEEIIHSAHQHRTSQKAYARLEKLIRNTPDLFRRVKQFRQANGEQQIELHNGHLLQYVTRSRTAIRGFSAKKIVWDEAQEVTLDQVAAVMPTVSAQYNWQHWFFGTPPDDPSAWCYGLKADGEAGVARLAHFDFGVDLNPEDADDREKALDLEFAYASNPALGTRIDIETVEDERRPSGLGERYAQERLGAWKPRSRGGANVIPDEVWRGRLVVPERPADVAFAAVVNAKRSHTAIASVGRRLDGRLQASIVAYQPGTHWVVAKFVDLKETWNPIGFAVQDKGPSATLIKPLADVEIEPSTDPDSPQRGDLAIPWAADVAKAYGLTIDALKPEGDDLLVHVDDGPLNVAVAGAATRSISSGGTTWDYKADADASPLQAVSLALWLFLDREGVDDDYDVADSFLWTGEEAHA